MISDESVALHGPTSGTSNISGDPSVNYKAPNICSLIISVRPINEAIICLINLFATSADQILH